MTDPIKSASTVEYPQRLARIYAEMDLIGADLMLIDQAELMAWVGGFTSSQTLYRVLLVPRHDAPWYVIRELDCGPCRERGWVDAIESYPDHVDGWQFAIDSIITHGFAGANIGIDPHSYGCTLESFLRLQQGLPKAQWRHFSHSGDQLRQVKLPSEIDCLKKAAQIADQSMQRIAGGIQAGDSAREASALAAGEFIRLGADSGDTGPIVRSAGDHQFLHSHQLDEPLQHGDILHVELIPKVHDYSARLMRPIVIGAPTPELSQLAQQLITLQDQQIAAMRAGAQALEIDAIVRQGVLNAGLRADYPNVTGYSLGQYARTPRLSDFSRCFHPKADWQLEENMVFHMYVSAGRLGFSETVRVGKTGGERLTQLQRALLVAG
ncbi:M24 family metallopeptidase [Celerinatantimonas sp. YJH-8]|uniref:M24 family metallopeptidase n=1 Tax=Celerinatantimonas sp. YJH-8 TaxID=3228714 RepID=UPI0038C279B5